MPSANSPSFVAGPSAIISPFLIWSPTLTSGFYGIVAGDTCSASDGDFEINFGNGYFGTTAVSSAGTNASGIGIFEYDVPTGYTALSTKGLNL